MVGRARDQGNHPIDSVPGTVICAADYLSQLAKLVVRGFIPAGLRSDPKIFTTATQPNGDKSPHHKFRQLLQIV